MKNMKQFKLWVDADLKDRIATAAKARGWSANREAVDALSRVFQAAPSALHATQQGGILSFEDRLAVLKAGIRPGSVELAWLMNGKL